VLAARVEGVAPSDPRLLATLAVLLAAAALTAALAGAGVRTPIAPADGGDHVFHQYVVATHARDALREHLAAQGIATAIHYPVPIHRTDAYASFGAGSLPVSETLAEESCSLPMHPSLTAEEIERVAAAVQGFGAALKKAA
jgi:dTDP-4-amino-4,6-dideoxygalactose transaminase